MLAWQKVHEWMPQHLCVMHSPRTYNSSHVHIMLSYRHTAYHKQTKNHWARDDPAFLLVMSLLVSLAACAYCLA